MNVWISNEADPTNNAPFLASETYTPNYEDCYYEDFSFGISLERVANLLNKLEGYAKIHIALYDDNNIMLAHSYDIETYFKYTDFAKQQAYFIGFQQGYSDGVNDGYHETFIFNDELFPTRKGKSYNNSCNYNNYDIRASYTNGYDTGYDSGVQNGLNQRLDEYKREQVELERKRKEWDEKYKDKIDPFYGGLLDKDGNFLPRRP